MTGLLYTASATAAIILALVSGTAFAAEVNTAQTIYLDVFAGVKCGPPLRPPKAYRGPEFSLQRAAVGFLDRQCGMVSDDVTSVNITCLSTWSNIMTPVGTTSIMRMVATFNGPPGTAARIQDDVTAAGPVNACSVLGFLCTDTTATVQILGGAVTRATRPPVTVSPYVVSTFAGVGSATGGLVPSATVGVAPLQAQLKNPNGVAVNSIGDVYIADAPSHTIKVVRASDGLVYIFAGVPNTRGSGADNTLATAHLLNTPRGVSVDANDTVYICDSLNHKIKRVPTRGPGAGFVTTVAGTGVLGSSGDGGPATSATLNNPRAVVFDTAQNIYWSDVDGHRIRKVTAATGIITTVVGTGIAGVPSLTPGQSATTQSINSARGLAVDPASNTLYISDTLNHQVLALLADGSLARVAGSGLPSGTTDGLNQPFGLAFDAVTRILYVCDVNNSVIKGILAEIPNSLFVYAGVAGSYGYRDGRADQALFYNPQSIALYQAPSGVGWAYLADSTNFRIRVVNTTVSLV